MKKFMILLSAFVMLFTVPALAAEETGSINVTLTADNKAVDVSDGTFKLYKVADIVKADNGDYVYEYTEDFAGCGYALDIEDAKLPQDLLAWADEADVAAKMSETPSLGKLAFDDLSLGLYLISQDVASDGYYAALPFLVSVPLYEDGAWVYSVDASPKMELVKKPTTNGNDGNGGNHDGNGNNGGTGSGGGSGSNGGSGGSGTSGSGTSGSGNAKTGDYNYFIYGVLVIGAAVVIVVTLRKRTGRSAQ